MDERDDPTSSSSSRQLPVNRECCHCPAESTPDKVWLHQMYQMRQFMRTVQSHYPLLLQGSHIGLGDPLAPNMMLPGALCPTALPSQTGPQGAMSLEVLSSGSIQQASVRPPGVVCTPSLSPGLHSGISRRMTQGPIPLEGYSVLNRIKREPSAQGPGSTPKCPTDAEVRMHVSEVQRLQYLHYYSQNQHITKETSLHLTPNGIPLAAKPTQDFKISPTDINTCNSKNSFENVDKRTQDSQGRVFMTNDKSRTSFVTAGECDPELCPSYKDLSGIKSDDDFITSALDMSMKIASSTAQTNAQLRHESPAKNADGSQNIVRKYRQDSLSSSKPNAGLQNQGCRPPLVDSDRGQTLTVGNAALPDVPDKEIREADVLPLTVAEVGFPSHKGRETPFKQALTPSSTPPVLKGMLQAQFTDKSTVASPSRARPLHHSHTCTLLHVPPSELQADSSTLRKQVGSESPTAQEAKARPQDRLGQVSEFMTSADEETDFRKRPPPDNKCPICEDKVSGYHYGMYSCESCKGFFKRTIHSRRHERLSCSFSRSCKVTLQSRKQCAACRFEKCLSLGMKLEAIRQDRQRGGRSLYQGSSEQRRLVKIKEELLESAHASPKKRKRSKPSTARDDDCTNATDSKASQFPISSTSRRQEEPLDSPTADHQPSAEGLLPRLIQDLVQQEEVFCQQTSVAQCCLDTLRQEKNLLETLCHFVNHQMTPLVRWAQGLPLYSQLVLDDQIRLLNRSILSIQCLNLIFYCLDPEGRLLLPQNQVIDLTTFSMAKFNQLVPKIATIGHQMHATGLDMPRFVCLKLIVLLNPDTLLLSDSDRVQTCQETAQEVFFTHVQPRDSRAPGKLLLVLSAVERVTQQLGQEMVWDLDSVDGLFHGKADAGRPERPWIQSRLV